MAVKKSIETSTAADKAQRLIYLGPNVNAVGLQKYQVFKGNLDKKIAELKTKFSLISLLFVKIEDMDKCMKAIEQEGTAEHEAYKQLRSGGANNGSV